MGAEPSEHIVEAFLEDDGTLPRDVMPDFLHPNEKGYRLWAAVMDVAAITLCFNRLSEELRSHTQSVDSMSSVRY